MPGSPDLIVNVLLPQRGGRAEYPGGAGLNAFAVRTLAREAARLGAAFVPT